MEKNQLKEYLNFDKMITPVIIKIIFWIGAGLSVLAGLIMIITGASSPWGGGTTVLAGLVTIILGPLAVRIYCELIILFFKMNENLAKLVKNKEELDR